MLRIKQEAFAAELGDDWNQKKVSLLEAKEVIDPAILERVAEVLKVPVAAIQNMSDEQAVNIISSTFHDSSIANTFNDAAQNNVKCTFNPLDKLVEAYEEIKRLNELLLKEKDERIVLLEQSMRR